LAAGNHHLALVGVGFEDEKECRRIVIHHHRAGATADLGDAIGHSSQTLAATALTDVVLEGDV